MDSRVIHNVVVVGTCRAGATLLMQLFTRLGLDTGYTTHTAVPDDLGEHADNGVERFLKDSKSAYLVINRDLFLEFESLLRSGQHKIDHLIIPIRFLDDAAASRIAVSAPTPQEFLDSYEHLTGDMYRHYRAHGQKDVLGRSVYNLIHTIAAFDVPHTLVDFPRFAQDARYLFQKLSPIFDTIDHSTFRTAFDDVVDLSLIHRSDSLGKDVA